MQRVAVRVAVRCTRSQARALPLALRQRVSWQQQQHLRKGAWLAAAAATAAAAAAAGTVGAECADAKKKKKDSKSYSPGQAIGEGLKGELWKAKHPDVAILETVEGAPALMLLSHVRNTETTGAAFVSYADRLLRALLDAACLALPNDEEAEFSVPCGAKMQGQLLELEGPICAITLLQDGEDLQLPLLGPLLPGDKPRRGLWGKALADTFLATGAHYGHIAVKDAHHVDARAVPAGVKDAEAVLLLASELAGAEPVLAALEQLGEMGVDMDNVVLVCATISKAACEKACSGAKGLNIVTGAVDPDVDAAGNVLPGIGGLYRRYIDSMEEMKHGPGAQKASKAPRKRVLGLF